MNQYSQSDQGCPISRDGLRRSLRHGSLRRMTLSAIVGVMLSVVGVAPAVAQGEPARVGFVSLDRILRDAAPAQRAQKKIEAEFAKRDQELGRSEQDLKKRQDALEKNAVTMSEADRRNREREFNEMTREFQRKRREFQEDLNSRRNEELSGVLERANAAVKRIAETEKFDIVFQDAVWASPRIDITDKVIRALDDTRPAGK
jgi:outer membrane protein